MKFRIFISVIMFLLITCEVNGQKLEYKTLKDTEFKEGDLIALPEIQYQLNGMSPVTKETLDSLDIVIDFLKSNEKLNVEIGCHTDQRGTEEGNLELSMRRSKWVMNYLISMGILEERLTCKGYGESQPIVSDEEIASKETKEEKEYLHQINRRTEMRILK